MRYYRLSLIWSRRSVMKKSGILIILLALSLQGCFFAAGAAAGAAAIAVVYDHRNIHKILQDADIAKRIANQINKIPGIHNEAHIEVSVFNRVVLLTGETPNPA